MSPPLKHYVRFDLIEVPCYHTQIWISIETMGTSLLKNINFILVEFRSTINLSCFVNNLFFLWLSDIVKFHYLYIFCDCRTDPVSDDEYELFGLFERYYQTAQEKSFPLPQGITTVHKEFCSHFIFALIPWSSIKEFKTR